MIGAGAAAGLFAAGVSRFLAESLPAAVKQGFPRSCGLSRRGRRSSRKGDDGKIEQDHQRDDQDQNQNDHGSGQTQVGVQKPRRDRPQQPARAQRNAVDLDISDEQRKQTGCGEDETGHARRRGRPDPELGVAEKTEGGDQKQDRQPEDADPQNPDQGIGDVGSDGADQIMEWRNFPRGCTPFSEKDRSG